MNRSAIPYLVMSSLFYASFTITIKHGFGIGLDPVSVTASMSLFALIITSIYALTRWKIVKKITRKRWIELLIIAFLATFIGRTLNILGTFYTTAINAGFLLKLTAVTTPIFAYFTLKERIGKIGFLAMIIMLAGVFLLTTDGKSLASFNLGDGLIILMTIAVGYSACLVKRIMKYLDPYTIATFRYIFGSAMILLLLTAFMGLDAFSALRGIGFWYCLVAAFFGTGIFFTLYKGIELTGASESYVFVLVSAVFTAILAFIFLGEAITLIAGIGGILILVGGYLLARRK